MSNQQNTQSPKDGWKRHVNYSTANKAFFSIIKQPCCNNKERFPQALCTGTLLKDLIQSAGVLQVRDQLWLQVNHTFHFLLQRNEGAELEERRHSRVCDVFAVWPWWIRVGCVCVTCKKWDLPELTTPPGLCDLWGVYLSLLWVIINNNNSCNVQQLTVVLHLVDMNLTA